MLVTAYLVPRPTALGPITHEPLHLPTIALTPFKSPPTSQITTKKHPNPTMPSLPLPIPLLLLTLLTKCLSHEITFPSILSLQEPLLTDRILSTADLDISSPVYAGLTTYANLPYVHCLADAATEVEKYDIAILGAPFDTVRFVSVIFDCSFVVGRVFSC